MTQAIQEYYDQIVQAVRDGVLPSYDKSMDVTVGAGEGNGCAYRHPDGKHRCVVGIRIPDELYEPSMEGVPVNRLPFDVLKIVCPEGMDTYDLHQLQSIHDNHARNSGDDFALGFLEDLNRAKCFQDVIQVDPEEVARELAESSHRQPVSA